MTPLIAVSILICRESSSFDHFHVFAADNFVTEEYEKCERTVPQWKITWCKENLTSMIGKDDTDLSRSRVGGPKKAKKKKKKTSRVAKAMGEQMKQMVDQ